MYSAAERPVLWYPGCDSRSSSTVRPCGASQQATDAPAMPAPTITKSASVTARGFSPASAPTSGRASDRDRQLAELLAGFEPGERRRHLVERGALLDHRPHPVLREIGRASCRE